MRTMPRPCGASRATTGGALTFIRLLVTGDHDDRVRRQRSHGASTCDGGRERRAMMPDRPMQWRALDVARAVARRQRRAGLGAAQKPAVAARQWRRRDRVHPCTAVSARTFVHRSHGPRGNLPPSGRQAPGPRRLCRPRRAERVRVPVGLVRSSAALHAAAQLGLVAGRELPWLTSGAGAWRAPRSRQDGQGEDPQQSRNGRPLSEAARVPWRVELRALPSTNLIRQIRSGALVNLCAHDAARVGPVERPRGEHRRRGARALILDGARCRQRSLLESGESVPWTAALRDGEEQGISTVHQAQTGARTNVRIGRIGADRKDRATLGTGASKAARPIACCRGRRLRVRRHREDDDLPRRPLRLRESQRTLRGPVQRRGGAAGPQHGAGRAAAA